ncbi:MAG: diaminopimelate decarboxylase [Planctomycetaceae bacterium]|nr:diaminopimelate decarboxylase [Planctomycetaceae bacterium]
MEHIPALNRELAFRIREQFGTPCYVYDEVALRRSAAAILAFPNAYGLTARFAMKACPNASVLRLFHELGLHIDASSGFEALRAIRAGVPAAHISLSTQQFPEDGLLRELVGQGMSVNACSLHQLTRYGRLFPGADVGVRFNPGLGSGGTQRTNVGGPASSFGIWHEQADAVAAALAEHGLNAFRVHTHIGSGSDPEVWLRAVSLSLNLVRRFPSVHTLNLGGGYKVGRMPHEKTTDLQVVGQPMKREFERFAEETGRRIHLEVEPGTYAVANAGAVLASVQDVASTGSEGYAFLKLDTGMTEVLRPSLYGAQHPMEVYPADDEPRGEREYIVVGHCCESGDILTPQPGDPEALAPRQFIESRIGDLLVIGGSGAYCAAMPAKNYNSFPEAPEVMIRLDGTLQLIRRRQTLDQMLENEY